MAHKKKKPAKTAYDRDEGGAFGPSAIETRQSKSKKRPKKKKVFIPLNDPWWKIQHT
jgi:hypothetical protein